MSATDPDLSMEERMSLSRIRRILVYSYDREEREHAIEHFLPYLWNRTPWINYRARCLLTNYVYLPFGLHFLEWMSLPHQFSKALRAQGYRTPPSTHKERRDAVVETLLAMLAHWIDAYSGFGSDLQPKTLASPTRHTGRPPNMGLGASICEVIGRLSIHEAQAELVELLLRVATSGGPVRSSVLTALSTLPPEQVPDLWKELKEGSSRNRHHLTAIFAYLYNPAVVPFLIDIFEHLEHQDTQYMATIGQKLLERLGYIGDPRALPLLNRIARNEHHPERPTAIKAIQRLMKQAEGQEEVTLLRGSSISTLDQDILLRATEEAPETANPRELLRSTAQEMSPTPTEESVRP